MRTSSILMLFLCGIVISIVAGDEFQVFMSKHGKKYSAAEVKKRKAIYQKNVADIKKLNAVCKKNKQNCQFAENKFTDMDIKEFEAKYTGLKISKSQRNLAKVGATTTTTRPTTTTTRPTTTTTRPTTTTTRPTTTTTRTTTTTTRPTTTTTRPTTTTTRTTTTTTRPTTATTRTTTTTTRPTTTTTRTTTTITRPTTTTTRTTTTTTTTKPTTTATSTTTKAPLSGVFDLTTSGYMQPVKNQGSCGSCWAFAVTAAAEFYYAKKSGTPVSFSEQMLVDCDKKSFGCSGGYISTAFAWERDNGSMSAVAYPYKAVGSTCAYNSASVISKIPAYSFTKLESEIYAGLQVNGPYVIAMAANNIKSYKGGILGAAQCNDTVVNHAVVVVGYGTQGGVDYWNIRNSWGAGWGEAGHFRLQRNINACNMVTYSSYYVKP